MKVAFSIGQYSARSVDSVKQFCDDIDFFIYDSVEALIKESRFRHVFFERIIYSEGILKDPEDDLNRLNDYIVENSDSTEVVLVCQSTTSPACEYFNKIFNSPLYTVVVLARVNTTVLRDIVMGSIVELHEKYYNSVLGGSPAVSSGHLVGARVDGVKSGFSEDKGVSPDADKQYRNSSESSMNRNANFGGSDPSYGGENFTNNSGISSTSKTYSGDILGLGDGVRGSVGSDYVGMENSGFSSEDEFLGLGNYGKSHSDTGFLDEDDLEKDSGKNEIFSDPEMIKKEKVREVEMESSNEEEDSDIDVKGMSKVIFVMGERGTGVTTMVTDIALDLYRGGESVLIVDADYLRNGVLSMIDSEDFYAKGNEDGIDTLNPYVDEEADIISNGYGGSLSKTSLSNLVFNRKIQSSYDRILIDCPLDCLSAITERIVRGNSVLLLVRGDRGSLVATSIGLTERTSVEVSLERYVMENCIVGVSGYSDDFESDVKYVKRTFFFPNGCWLDNIVL